MAFLAQVTTLVYTAVLAPDSGLTPDLSRLAFGALLWIVLVILNRGTAGASPETLRPRGWVATRRPSIPFNDLQPARSYLGALRRPAAGGRSWPPGVEEDTSWRQ